VNQQVGTKPYLRTAKYFLLVPENRASG